MPFVYRCLAVDDVKRAIRTRCSEYPAKNGILCEKHLKDAEKKPIHILMHHEVTKKYGIPYKGQLTVTINLKSKENKEPVSNSAADEIIRITKVNLVEQLNLMKIPEIKIMHDDLGLDIWKSMKDKLNEYAFKYFICKAIVDKIYVESITK